MHVNDICADRDVDGDRYVQPRAGREDAVIGMGEISLENR
jgi:hypothetical protein